MMRFARPIALAARLYACIKPGAGRWGDAFVPPWVRTDADLEAHVEDAGWGGGGQARNVSGFANFSRLPP